MDIKSARNTKDLQAISKKKLPNPIYHFIEGGAKFGIPYALSAMAADNWIPHPYRLIVSNPFAIPLAMILSWLSKGEFGAVIILLKP